MNYFKYDIVFQEIPGEISLAIYFTGCPLHCKGCHSKELWDPQNGEPFSVELLKNLMTRYRNGISCVLFMGGDWDLPNLNLFLSIVCEEKIKVALYTGREREDLPVSVVNQLDFLKTGPWREEFGGLTSPTTNQKFFKRTIQEVPCF